MKAKIQSEQSVCHSIVSPRLWLYDDEMKPRKHKGKISPLSAEIAPVLRRLGHGQNQMHPEIWARWASIVGAQLARCTVPRSLRYGTLIVGVKNSSWMHEITYLKMKLLERFTEAVGPGVVKEIRFTVDNSLSLPSIAENETELAPKVKPPPVTKEIAEATKSVRDETLRESIQRAMMANLK
jgi:hypothetical protein